MRRSTGLRLAAAGLALLLSGGCFRPSSPRLDLAQLAPLAATLDLKPYMQAARCGRWVYERTEIGPGVEPLVTVYVRSATAQRVSEGWLEPHALPPIQRYIRDDETRGTTTRPAHEPRPAPLPASYSPQLFELVQPLEPIPLELIHAQPVTTTTELRCYNRHGRLDSIGVLTRRVQIDGMDDVECPAGRFGNCLRVHVELRIEFPIGPTIDWDSYVWLSRVAGEVRRIEDFSGALWIFGFGSAHEYRLVSYTRDTSASPSVQLSPKWARGLITLDRGVPRPRISGMVVDFATTQPAE
jgi:hypothetical protein